MLAKFRGEALAVINRCVGTNRCTCYEMEDNLIKVTEKNFDKLNLGRAKGFIERSIRSNETDM